MKNIPHKEVLVLIGDIVLILASFYLAPLIRFEIFIDPSEIFGFLDIVALLVYLLTLYIFDFYNLEERTGKTAFILRFSLCIIIVNLINSSVFYVSHLRPSSSSILAISGSFAFVFLITWRFAFRYVVQTVKPLRILILGAGRTGKSLYNYLMSRKDFEVIGFVDDDREKKELIVGESRVLGTAGDLPCLIRKHDIDQVIVAITNQIKPEVFGSLVEIKFNGVEVYEMPTFYEKVA
ncbi:MAG: hypothetical protein PHN75_11030, partial [Syntrophales bacterium]|nr:hypothetical protein [Syntrophales bacterium]